MDSTVFAAFVAAAIPAFFTPGPNNLMLMASGAKFGFQRTMPHASGVVVGFALMVVLVGFGLGEVFEFLPWLKTALKYLSAVYLLWLAWSLLGLKIGTAEANERPLSFLQAAAFQWINPKAWAMAVSFVALVVDPGPGRLVGVLLLGLGCLVLGPFSSGLWMVFGDRLEAVLRRTGGERFVGIVLALLVVVSVVLFLL